MFIRGVGIFFWEGMRKVLYISCFVSFSNEMQEIPDCNDISLYSNFEMDKVEKI